MIKVKNVIKHTYYDIINYVRSSEQKKNKKTTEYYIAKVHTGMRKITIQYNII